MPPSRKRGPATTLAACADGDAADPTLTTGGTGPTLRDVIDEAIGALERIVDHAVELVRQERIGH